MKRILLILTLSIFCLAAFIFSGCGNGSKQQASVETDKPIQFRMNLPITERHIEIRDPMGIAYQTFVDYLEENGSGVFDIEPFFGDQLARGIDETMPALQSGAFEVGGSPYGALGGVTQAFMPFNFPFLLSTYDQAENFWDGPVGQRIREDAEKDMDVKILYSVYIGFRHITNSRGQIKTPADMAGLKIRTMPDPFQVAAMNSLGAAATPVPWSELFTALQQKVVDAQENPYSNIYNFNLYEVQNYLTETGHNFTMAGHFLDRKWFNSLPENAQQLLMDAGRAAEKSSLAVLKEEEARIKDELANELGMIIYQPTPEELQQFQELSVSVYEDIKEVIGDEYYDFIMKEAEVAK